MDLKSVCRGIFTTEKELDTKTSVDRGRLDSGGDAVCSRALRCRCAPPIASFRLLSFSPPAWDLTEGPRTEGQA